MKTLKNRIARFIQGISFPALKIISIPVVIVLVSLYSCSTPYMASQNPDGGYMSPPAWAQSYDNENPVNYYYLPDIECYYDLRHREFVYLQNGAWRFSASLPSIYASFDLNNCFVVKLNNNVHEPWMHFHYYVAHYPRYFYKSIERENYHNYGHSPRWFNENVKHYGYNNRENNEYREHKENRQGSGSGNDQNKKKYNNKENKRAGDRNEMRQGTGQPEARNQGDFSNKGSNNNGNRNDARQSQDTRQNNPQKNEGSVNREQPMKYYGKQIGEPVKVQRNMRKSQENKGGVKRQEKKERKND